MVGSVGKWRTCVQKNKSKQEKREQLVFQAPVPWRHYAKRGEDGGLVRMKTNVRLVRHIWTRKVHPECIRNRNLAPKALHFLNSRKQVVADPR